MKKNYFTAALITISLLFSNCNTPPPDFAAETKKLMALHEAQQKNHLQENAHEFVKQFADSVLNVNKGKITLTDTATASKRFQSYFDKVTFKKWKDVTPPRIDFSADASMAYMTVDKLVILTYVDEQQKTVEASTHFAWVAIFKKQINGEWKLVCNASTNEPETTRILD